MNLSFRTRMLPWAIVNALSVGLWTRSPGAGVITFSAWWLTVYSTQEICDAIRAAQPIKESKDAGNEDDV